MTRIVQVLTVPGAGAGWYEDAAALQAQRLSPGERFTAPPVTPGFRAAREVAEALSVGLVLDDGRVAWGDCVAGAAGSAPGGAGLFRADGGRSTIEQVVAPVLEGETLDSFRELAATIDLLEEAVEVVRPASPASSPVLSSPKELSRRDLLTAPGRLLQAARGEPDHAEPVTIRRRLHPAVRYGLSQALLRAVAMDRGVTMAEVIASEWDLPRPDAVIAIHARSGGGRCYEVERMMARRVASLPHDLPGGNPDSVGLDGSGLTRYIRWLKERSQVLGGQDYQPAIHMDVQGTLGRIYDNQLGRMLGQLYAWELAAGPCLLRIENPVIMEGRDEQVETLRALREYVDLRKMKVQLVAGAWTNTLEDIRAFVDGRAAHMVQIKMPALGSMHNTVEAVLACKAIGLGACLGGSRGETDVSARASAHVALATRPDLLMAKPGGGVDEAISLVQNEMARCLAQIELRAG